MTHSLAAVRPSRHETPVENARDNPPAAAVASRLVAGDALLFRDAATLLRAVPIVILIAPFFLLFEVWQLVLSERYLGIKQIARGADPRSLGLGEVTAFFWSTLLVLYWLWMLLLLMAPFGRTHGLSLLAVTLIGFSLRRGSPLKWVLVVLTFEGAVRVGLLLSLCVMAWRRL